MGNVADLRRLAHDGCSLAYRVEGAGPPVLMIQGVGVHAEGWRPQIDGLSDEFRCVSFDNRGIGRSQPPAGPLTIERMAADVTALLDHEGIESAHIVGHSMGGAIAIELAARAPERVRSLSLLCTFARFRDAFLASPRLAWVGIRSRIGTRRMRRHAFLELVMPPRVRRESDLDALAEELVPIFGHDLADAPPATLQQGSALAAYNGWPRLPRLAGIPTLVVSATHDPIGSPKVGRSLAAAISDARYVEIEDAAHGVTVQQPERTNSLLRGHFAVAESARADAKAARSALAG